MLKIYMTASHGQRVGSLFFMIIMMIFALNGYSHERHTIMPWDVIDQDLKAITGTVTDEDGEPLLGATVVIKGTTRGTITDFDGGYTLDADEGDILVASYLGYISEEIAVGSQSVYDFVLQEGVELEEMVIIGTRAANRTNVSSPVPVDVLNVDKLSAAAPQVSLNQLLHATTPAFSSNTQTISDGTDHIDPASLRGLGPDQVLVLMNQKRRHSTSLVNVNGTFGRGNVGTDLNAIPSTAIGSIEVLRDGAAAQYGSDAIAGVINLRLKRTVGKLGVNFSTGANFTSNIGQFGIGEEPRSVDGEVINLGINYGVPLGNNGGFINLTGEYNQRQPTQRMLDYTGSIFSVYNGIERVAMADGADISALTLEQIQQYAPGVGYLGTDQLGLIYSATSLADLSSLFTTNVTDQELAARNLTSQDFNMRVGQSGLKGGAFFANMELPLDDNWKLYGFGGLSYRRGESGCFYRLPNQNRTVTAIWPNGTVPRINSNISDRSFSGGIKGDLNGWSTDLSFTTGNNEFLYQMTQTHNATLGASSPTTFDVGGHRFIQSTANFDMSKYFEMDGIVGLNVAFGGEYRYENYQVDPGVESSYGNYTINGELAGPTTEDHLLTTDIAGRSRPSGSQCFAGFLPANEVDARRTSRALYFDLEADISESFLLGGALRYENFDDFGSTFNWKLAARYSISPAFNLRGAMSTGFRAPSLHQINYNKTSTIFVLNDAGESVPTERGVFSNNSRAAQLLGIPQLVEETSSNLSLGFTALVPNTNMRLTVDAYQINIDDRVILTGAFSAGSSEELQIIFNQAQAGSAVFFANAIDTRSRGLDIVLSGSSSLSENIRFNYDVAATFSKTTWDRDISQSDLDSDDPRVVSNGVKASKILVDNGLVGTYFDQTSRIYLEQAVPRVKITASPSLDIGNFNVYLRGTYYGETTEAVNNPSSNPIFDQDLNYLSESGIDPYNSGKILFDLSFGYRLSKAVNITVGGQNIFDTYPDVVDDAFISSGRFRYSRRSPQFSFGGRYLFARLAFTL